VAYRQRPRMMVRRPRKKGAWAGNFTNSLALPGGSITSFNIWDTTDWDSQNMVGVATHRVTRLSGVCWQPNNAPTNVPGVLAWYLCLFQVDSAFAGIPTTSIWDPLSPPTLDNFERRVLGSGYLEIPGSPAASVGGARGLQLDFTFEAKRRVTSDDWLVFVMRPTLTCTISLHARTNIAC